MNHIADTKNIRNSQQMSNSLKLGFPRFDTTVSKIERKRDEIGSGYPSVREEDVVGYFLEAHGFVQPFVINSLLRRRNWYPPLSNLIRPAVPE
jgi:hypothetical protein